MKFNLFILAIILFAAVFTTVEAKSERKHKKTHHKTLVSAKALLNAIVDGAGEPEPGKAVIMYEIPGHTAPTRLRRVK